MKNRVAKLIKFHDAIQIGGVVLTSVEINRHAPHLKTELELWPVGVHFIFAGTDKVEHDMLIPYTNTPYMELVPLESK